ncbi:gastric triacylglycerol lipase-like [Octopus vulgaris]|nr:gastric triacylglycerol lipase-like [Octopus vulgaris]
MIPLDPEVYMNASQLITSKGYPCEDHTVLTEDGFYLEMQRIPHGIKNQDTKKVRPVVFLQHGVLGSSTNFLTNLANESLAFILADAGYDVWLGNSRGNTYGRRHILYPTSSAMFWRWSFDHMAAFDLPASLDYVTNVTGQEKLYYVAHSQGSLIGFLAFSENQTLAKKIKLMVALGPVYTVGHITSSVRFATIIDDKVLFNIFGRKSFLPENLIISTVAKTVCRARRLNFLCKEAIRIVANFDNQYMNSSRIPVYLTHSPAGTSTQNMAHFAQLVRSKDCKKYDYGTQAENLLHYGHPTPPAYNVSKLKIPVALYSGGRDNLADPKDVALLVKKLKTKVTHVVIPKWAHLEFVWAVDGWDTMYKQMIDLLRKY